VEFIYQETFANCSSLESVKVLAETPPFLYENSFSNYNIPLYVPESAVEAYQTTSPWSKFSQFKTLDGTEVEIKKCAKPTIAYMDGKLTFSSDTEDVQYVYTITDADVRQGNGAEVGLDATYNVSVRATRNGYEDSETATATYSWKGITPMMNGDAAKYRLSFIADNKELSVQNVEVGTTITVPTTTDSEGNTITWYTYPSTMPAHDLVVCGMVVKPAPEPAPTKYTLTYMLDGQEYKQESIEEGAAVAMETEPSKEGYTFSGWQNEPTTMPGRNVTVNGSFTINSYRLSFIAETRELSAKNQQYGSAITAPATDGEGNTITWYTYPSTMPANDLVVYGMVVKQAEPEVFVWLTLKDGQGTTTLKVKQGTEQVLAITPEEGWKLLTVTMDGQDVTAQVKDGGTLTTPAIMQDATIAVVYEQEVPSEVTAARQSKATVKVVDDGVVISNAEADTRCTVYASSGQQVVSTVIDGGNRKIALPKGQVYVLTLGTRTLKFAL
jgi:hypothetical protein